MAKETIIEYAFRRLMETIEQNELGAANGNDIMYWRAYLDGAKAQAKEDKVI